jgi:hypothetical protein
MNKCSGFLLNNSAIENNDFLFVENARNLIVTLFSWLCSRARSRIFGFIF